MYNVHVHVHVYTCMHAFMYICVGEDVPLADYELPLSKAEIIQPGMYICTCTHIHVQLYTCKTV